MNKTDLKNTLQGYSDNIKSKVVLKKEIDPIISNISNNPPSSKAVATYVTEKIEEVNISKNDNPHIVTNVQGTGHLSFNRKPGTVIGDKSSTLGRNCTATGEGSISTGEETVSTGRYSYTEGGKDGTPSFGIPNQTGLIIYSNTNNSDYSHAEGSMNYIEDKSKNSHAEGKYNSLINSPYSHIEGYLNQVNNDASFSSGQNHIEGGGHNDKNNKNMTVCHIEGGNNKYNTISYAHLEGASNKIESCSCAHVEGNGNSIIGADSGHAEGYFTQVLGKGAHAEGAADSSIDYYINPYYTDSTGNNRVYGSLAVGKGSHSEGRNTAAIGDWSHAAGYKTSAIGNYSSAKGELTIARGADSHAEGNGTNASGGNAHSEGYRTTASGNNSHAEGNSSSASGGNSHAEGANTTASGSYSHAEGFYTNTAGAYSHAEGGCDNSQYYFIINGAQYKYKGTLSQGMASHSEGHNTLAFGDCSHAEGFRTLSQGIGSHAEGDTTKAIGKGSHSEGQMSTASGIGSHVEGNYTNATGNFSHAEGGFATASGIGSHAEGYRTTASGDYSHGEGSDSNASGNNSHAEGYNTTASNYSSHSIGKYNRSMVVGGTLNNQVGDVFVIGNGVSSYSKSNAFRITYRGEAYGLSAFNTSGADYAEFVYPWEDGNLKIEDRVGYFVTFKDKKIRKATSKDPILGIISGCPSIVGNSDEDYFWKYERDDFNRVIIENVEPDENDPENSIAGTRMKISDDYDNTMQEKYIQRKDRSEWDYVGMLGVLPVRDDDTCIPGQYCKCSDDGIATLADLNDAMTNRYTYIVLERVSENIVKVLK